jgi:predicted nucleic acid-binding protein
MSGNRYLADTNAFIYLLQRRPFILQLLQYEWSYTFITEIELLGKPRIKSTETKVIRQMLGASMKLAHTDAINEKAIALKQRYALKTPDAIIAASALHHELPLLTADTDFSKSKS